MGAEFEELLRMFRERVARVPGASIVPFRDGLMQELAPRDLAPRGLACLARLDRLAAGAEPEEKPLVVLIAALRDRLHWGQTYTVEDFGQAFVDNYGWMEIAGTRGHFASDSVAAGVLILGPDIHYPDHHHEAEEIYIPLAGAAEWRKGDGEFVARRPGETIHHPSNVNHAMRTGSEPLVALYLWRGGPLAARSTVTGSIS